MIRCFFWPPEYKRAPDLVERRPAGVFIDPVSCRGPAKSIGALWARLPFEEDGPSIAHLAFPHKEAVAAGTAEGTRCSQHRGNIW